MSIKKIPLNDQAILSASVCINNYKRAVEELVYNSLDAESTSIAVRVNIEESFIQILDNGNGIEKANFTLLGKKYSTSKFINITTLKSAPNKYGFRGLCLWSLIEISQSVKISSKVINCNETWIKTFNKGKEKNINLHTNRPSKGTTVEIIGFLYNLKIQKNATEPVKELQNIKTFLQQLSLVHNNVSISLRDDCRNEIVFTINKNRDVYQTLRCLFNIEHNNVQDLQVEKKHYKVRGFIGKNKESTKKYKWIYLNGKIINKTIIHKKINAMFNKITYMHGHGNKKNKNIPAEENYLVKNDFPHYFIFISCPNLDFDIIYKNNETIVEFKNWQKVEKLLEKLVKFYFGNLSLKPITKYEETNIHQNKRSNDTRKRVKDIMEKILNNHACNPRISQLKHGVKGKNVKRKKEPKIKLQDITNKKKISSKINLLKKPVDLTKIIDRKNKITPICKDNLKQSNLIKNHLNKKKKKHSSYKTHNQYITPQSLKKTQDEVIINNRGTICKQKAKVLNSKKYDKSEKYRNYQNNLQRREYTWKDSIKQNYVSKNSNPYLNNLEIKTTYDLLNPAVVIHSSRPLEDNQQIYIHQETQSYVATCETYFPKTTFDSHNYHKDIKARKNIVKKFISSNSCNNFLLQKNSIRKNKVMYESSHLKKMKGTLRYKLLNKPRIISPCTNETEKENRQSNIIETSYTGSINFEEKYNSQNVNVKKYSIDINYENTYTIDMQSSSFFAYNNNYNKTYSLQTCNNFSFKNKSLHSLIITQNETSYGNVEEHLNKNISNVDENLKNVIISESQSLEPLNFCETLLQSDKLSEINTSSVNNNKVDEITELKSKNIANVEEEINNGELNDELDEYNGIIIDTNMSDQIVTEISKDPCNVNKQNVVQEQIVEGKFDSNSIHYNDLNDFKLKSRHNFVPKGMSQIFNNNYKMACALDNSQEYYENDVYKNFANDILNNFKIYEPEIENVKDIVSKDLKKVKNKLNKDNADLIFDCQSLKIAEVFGQVDAKFILAIIKGRTSESGTFFNFLALFDQHAVDERVRLESNLDDYLKGNEWASVSIDSVIKIKLNQEDYFYVYNYKEKFYHFGLRWTFEDKEILIHAIPAAILGKNIREVDVVMKAVKNLISELVDVIKALRGNVSSYPKSIMNLICSEACRYAIKFGDKLSKNDCVNLINALSKCKTPFQCAHGRPVMAILIELTNNETIYKINLNKVKRFKTIL